MRRSVSGTSASRAEAVARNVEIKARIGSVPALEPRVRAIAGPQCTELRQTDVFFNCAGGRLKLRHLAGAPAELIYYRRPDDRGPRESFYLRTQVPDAAGLERQLACAYGIRAMVRKRRLVYISGRTRIHLDEVEGLGHFLELEVVLSEDEPAATGVHEARALMERLGIAEAQLIPGAYVDLAPAAAPPG
jgi:predicted adenylyl cyclase CyaB